jgi:hypothetical protein
MRVHRAGIDRPMNTQLPAAPTSSPDPAPPEARRPRFWLGFLAGFVLLAVVSCGAMAALAGVDSIDLRTLPAAGQAWTPPAVTPSPTPDPNAAPAGDPALLGPGAFVAGQQVRNITSGLVNLRATPGHLSKPLGDILAQAKPGDALEILGDRALADSLVWWRVRYRTADGAALEGWVAEATASGVQILGQ